MKKLFLSLSIVLLLVGVSGCKSDSVFDTGSVGTDDTSPVVVEEPTPEPSPVATEEPTPVVTKTLSGTFAVGKGVKGRIIFTDPKGRTQEVDTDDDGFYRINLETITPPIFIYGYDHNGNGGGHMYAVATADEEVANITPLTSYIVDRAAVASGLHGGASELLKSFQLSNVPDSLFANITNETAILNNIIAPEMESYGLGGFNHFSDSFVANHKGYDALLDDLDITLYQDDVVIRIDDTTLDTLNGEINATKIKIIASLIDAKTGSAIADANVTFSDGHNADIVGNSDANGSVSQTVDTKRIYNITIAATGYQTQTIANVSSFSSTTVDIGFKQMALTKESELMHVSGYASIDLENPIIANTELRFRSGYIVENGVTNLEDISDAPIATVTTDASGHYDVDLPVGIYRVEAFNVEWEYYVGILNLYTVLDVIESTDDANLSYVHPQ